MPGALQKRTMDEEGRRRLEAVRDLARAAARLERRLRRALSERARRNATHEGGRP